MKILLAVDGSDYSKRAVESIAARPWPADSEIKVLSAIELPFSPSPEVWALPDSYYAQLQKQATESATKAAQEAADFLTQTAATPLRISTATELGLAREVILDTAEKWEADLIVLGSHGYNAFKRFMLGSVSHAVATHAPCSVEIVRTRKAAHA
ncbi:MAG: universal stress protein [Acidobacteria bacterium]|nr:universal stress protein [Acidobacteriota bacterium]